MKESGVSEFIFVVQVGDKVCLVQADQAILLDNGTLEFVIHNTPNVTVAAFKNYDHFFTQGNQINENI